MTTAILPTVEEVLADPVNALLPNVFAHWIEARTLVLAAVEIDSAAAWIYLDRFPEQFITSVFKPMAARWRRRRIGQRIGTTPQEDAGRAVFVRRLKELWQLRGLE